MAETLKCPRCDAPYPVGQRFCASCGAPLEDHPREERRVVTVLFGDLSGFTELTERRDAEEVKGVVDRAFEELARIVVGFGGRVDKIIGDEIMAVFGAPQAHEDDAERAVRASLQIQRALAVLSTETERERGFPLQMHIGINTGEVVAGFVGGSDSYTVLGDAVNTARRINQAADPGQILVGETTYEAARNAIEFARVGAVTAKGKRLPVTVYEVIAERGLPGERTLRAAPLIGREEELQVLTSLSVIVRRDRRPMLATIVGDAGMGKSRLAAEFARRIWSQGIRVVAGRSLPYGTASPAFALEQMLRAALAVDSVAGADDVRAQVREKLDGLGLGAEAERVFAILGLSPAMSSKRAPAPGTSVSSPNANPLLDTAMTVLERIAEREGILALALHEAHWTEDDVLDAISSALRTSRAPLFVLCLARPDLIERRPGWGVAPGSLILPLEPLPRPRAAELLDALAPELPLTLREGVLERAGGNPFYLEELARLLIDRPGAAAGQFAVPGSVQALVTARLDALPSDEKRLLQDAAVVGEQFWPGAIEQLEPLPANAESVLGSLVAQGFIEPSESDALPKERAYRFRQTLVREVAYASVPKHVRAHQHAAVAGWLENSSAAAGAQDEFTDLIGHHFERAATLAREIGDLEPEAERKAHGFLVRAGDRALGMDATSTAVSFFERALALSPNDRTVRMRLGEALVGVQRHTDAQPHLERALEEARADGDIAAEAKMLRLLGDSFRMRGDVDRARDVLAGALDLAKQAKDEREEAEGLRSHGLLDMIQGKWSSSALWFRQALARYRALGDHRGEGWSLQNLGWANMLMGRLDEALEYLEEGEKLFKDLNDEEGAGWCMGMRGWVLLMRGDVLEAGAIAEKIEYHLTVEHPEYAAHSGFALELMRVLRAYVDVLRGNLAAAETIARAAVDDGEWSSASWAQALGQYPLAAVALLQRRFGAARSAIEAGGNAARQNGDPFYIGLFRYASAWLAFEEERFDDAARILDELIAHGEIGRVWAASAGARYLQARIAQTQGRADDARALLAERLGSRNIGLVTEAWTGALLAELLAEKGDLDAALTTARAAVHRAAGGVLGDAVAHRALAMVLLATGDASGAEEAIRHELELLADSDWVVERAKALAVLARVLDQQRRHDEAADAFDKARAALDTLPPDADRSTLDASLLG